jgi:hypothetical protein
MDTVTWLGGWGGESRDGGTTSAGWKSSRRSKFYSGSGGGVFLPAPSTEISRLGGTQDDKLSAPAPEPSEHP